MNRRPRAAAGFTLVEVMVALTLMTGTVMVVLSMQKQVITANRHARHVEMATQIAENWLERLKMDAREWPTVTPAMAAMAPFNAGAPNVTALAATQWLQQINGLPGQFQTIAINPNPAVGSGPNVSNAFNYQGQDVLPGIAGNPHFFCASFRLNWGRWPAGGFPRSINAVVRVWWPRERRGISAATDANFAGCIDGDANLSPGGADNANYHFVYVGTTISST